MTSPEGGASRSTTIEGAAEPATVPSPTITEAKVAEEEIRARLMQYWNRRGGRPLVGVSLAWNAARIDLVAMHGGYLSGFEIKSERDTLERLKQQAKRYRRYFRRLYLVTTEHHVASALTLVPQ